MQDFRNQEYTRWFFLVATKFKLYIILLFHLLVFYLGNSRAWCRFCAFVGCEVLEVEHYILDSVFSLGAILKIVL